MAEDIVGGLFGVNPAMYQQQQQQQVFNRAVALQNLDPFQQAAVGVQQAGYNLAGALGGALGGVDPQLQRISTLNAISKQIDQTNPESMLQGARMLADAGFTQEALGLAQYARKANSEIALAEQRRKEGRAAAGTDAVFAKINPSDYTPESVRAFIASSNYGDLVPKVGKADKLVSPVNPSDYTPASIAAFNVSGNYGDLVLKPSKADKPERLIGNINPESYTPASVAAFSLSNDYNDLVLKPEKTKDNKNIANVNPTDFTPASIAKFSESGNYADLELKPEKAAADKAPPSVGGDAERISQRLYGKRFSQLTQAEAAIVDAEVEKRDLAGKSASAPKIQNILPGTEKLVDVPAFRRTVQGTIDSQLKVIDATDTALVNIDDSIKTNNFASYRAAQVQFAKAIAGAGDLSTKELLAAGADPSLLGGTADYLSRLFSSTPTLDTQNNIRKTLLAIRKVAANKAQVEVDQQRKIAEQSDYPKAALDTALNFPQLKPYQGGAKASKTLTTKSGKTVTVTEE